jgi:hypothetical protein
VWLLQSHKKAQIRVGCDYSQCLGAIRRDPIPLHFDVKGVRTINREVWRVPAFPVINKRVFLVTTGETLGFQGLFNLCFEP